MNTETYQFVLALSGSVIALLLIIIGFFLRLQVLATKSLTQSVNLLTTSVEVLKTNQDNSTSGCTARHLTVDTRLNDHAKRLNEHEKDLTELKVKIP